MLTTQLVKTFHSTKQNADFHLYRIFENGCKDVSYCLHKVKDGKETPLLQKASGVVSKTGNQNGIFRAVYNGDKFVPTTTLIRKGRMPYGFCINKKNGNAIYGLFDKNEVSNWNVIEKDTIGGVSEDYIPPMAARLFKKIGKQFMQMFEK